MKTIISMNELFMNSILPMKLHAQVSSFMHAFVSDQKQLNKLIAVEHDRYQEFVQELGYTKKDQVSKLKTLEYDILIPNFPGTAEAVNAVKKQSVFTPVINK